MSRFIYISVRIICGIIFAISSAIFCASNWVSKSLDVSFTQILNTIIDPLEGADFTSFLKSQEAKQQILILSILCLTLIATVVIEAIIARFVNNGKIEPRRLSFYRGIIISLFIVLSIGFLSLSWINLRVGEYIATSKQTTTIYEDYYVSTTLDLISSSETTPQNLIFIYMESMEATFANQKVGGFSEDNLIPNLTDLAKQNTSFSPGGIVGAIHVTDHADYTKGALYASTTGIPYYSVIAGKGDYTRGFIRDVVALGDVLNHYGYTNEFICGSDADFGGRATYFKEHGDYKIMDYYAAVKKGFIPKDYSVWWGYEDKRLYEITKSELSELAESEKPFNCTILTVDTHYPDGFVCDLCGNEYHDQFSNVLACADKQVNSFIDWCSEQSWYDNTTIVIMGDHPSMNKTAFKNIPASSRMVYNCFINSVIDKPENEKARISTTFDVFPTTLSAMGFSIKGHRLGFGTDLYSGEKTLAEVMGFAELNKQISMKSRYKGLSTVDPMEWDEYVDKSSFPHQKYLEDTGQE